MNPPAAAGAPINHGHETRTPPRQSAEGPVPHGTERILIFGGSFDPPHQAHVALPALVADECHCDRVLYIPTSANPLKEHVPAPAGHRLAMLALALASVPRTAISTIELYRPGPSYTIDTLAALRRELGPRTDLRLLLGPDTALSFPRWKDPAGILALATPIVMLRRPCTPAEFRAQLRGAGVAEADLDRWVSWTVAVPDTPITSSQVRQRVAAGEDIRDMVHPAVARYIFEHGLYGACCGHA